MKKNTSRYVGGILFLCILFSQICFIPSASATMYQPGATLEPDCAPGSANCGVEVVAGANIGNANLILTAPRSLSLDGNSLTFDGTTGDIIVNDNGSLSISGGLDVGGAATFSALTTFGNVSTTELTTSGYLSVSGDFISPKGADYSTTGVQNDVNLGVGSLFRYTGLNTATFSGLSGGTDGKQIRIMNTSAFSLTLTNEDAGSVAANRIITAGGGNLTIPTNVSVGLQYDAGASRWRVVVLPATSATVSGFAFVQGGNGFGAAANLGTTDANALNLITAGNTRFTIASGASTLTGTGATTLTTNSTLDLSSAAGSALNVLSGTTGAVTLDSGTTGNVNVGTGASAKTITIGNGTGGTTLNLQSGTGNIILQVAGAATTGHVQIGAGGSATPDLLVLDVKNDNATDPTGTNGAMYYNSASGKFRCFQNSAWTNCITPPGADSQHVSTQKTNETLINIPDGGAQITLATISITPTQSTGDIYIAAEADVLSSNNIDQTVTLVIETTANCTGATVGNASVSYDITSPSSNAAIRAALRISAIVVDPGAAQQTYSLCAAETSANAGDTDVEYYMMEAVVIDTGADLAEIYTTNDASIKPGDVVSLDPNLKTGIRKSSGTMDWSAIGIVSTRPGMLIGSVTKEGVQALPVALSGRVPVKVVTENGNIEPGDFLSPSSIPGVAMKSNGMGSVIGQAFSGYTGDGEGTVLAYVKNFTQGSYAIDAGALDALTTSSVEAIQSEQAHNPVETIKNKIINKVVFISDFITARITAIRGYFDEVFANKTHQKLLCIGEAGDETCLNKSQLDALLSGQVPPSVQPAPPSPSVEPVNPPASPSTDSAVESPLPTPEGVAASSTPEAIEPIAPAPATDPVAEAPEAAPPSEASPSEAPPSEAPPSEVSQ